LREEHRLRVFENRVLRRIFGPKREEDECGENCIMMNFTTCMRWAGHVARMGEGRGIYMVLVGRLERKRPLGRPRRRWENNIKMDLREIGIDGANWIHLAEDRVQWRTFLNTVINLRVP
jgi:hypothetical protein